MTIEEYIRGELLAMLECRFFTERCNYPDCTISDCQKHWTPSEGSSEAEPLNTVEAPPGSSLFPVPRLP